MKSSLTPIQTWSLAASISLLIVSCNPASTPGGETTYGDTEVPEAIDTTAPAQVEIPSPEVSPDFIYQPAELPMELIHPDDIVYRGAFRLPETSDEYGWGYSGYAMAFYPDGDPSGPQDNFPGSLFVVGHDQIQHVAEIGIPAPVISEAKDVYELPTATMLQPFADITGGMFGELEIPRAGLAYLPPQGSQVTGKLYFCWGQHFQFELAPSHGWSELDLSTPSPAGPWFISDFTNYVTNDYLFEIPEAWAATYAPGLRLATGRFRDGSWGGLGPTLLAIAPWMEGNPPPPNSTLEQVIPLLLYGDPIPGSPEIGVSDDRRMLTYSEPDEWSGGAWLSVNEKSAVAFIGTKAIGNSWYGFSNGVEYPTSGDPDEEYPDVPPWPHDERGWWSEDISAQIVFYDPSQLGAVARGEWETWDPQPYASLSLDEYLYDPGFDFERAKRYLVGAAAFDQDHGLLYVVERMVDEDDRSLIHVFGIE